MLGGLALSEAIPFNRVWSFPSKIVIPGAAWYGKGIDPAVAAYYIAWVNSVPPVPPPWPPVFLLPAERQPLDFYWRDDPRN